MKCRLTGSIVCLLVCLLLPAVAIGQSDSPAHAADTLRSALIQAQLTLPSDLSNAQQALATAQTTYHAALAPVLLRAAPDAGERVQAGFDAAEQAISATNAPALAAACAQIWTGLLQGSYGVVAQAFGQNDAATAKTWLLLREFRTATRFSRPNADATLATTGFAAGTLSAADALGAVRADLLDTYQSRLTEALSDLATADEQHFATRRAEAAALADGYFAILAPAYAEQRSPAARDDARRAFAELRAAALGGQPLAGPLAKVEAALAGFRAAPLNAAEQTRRAGQLLRFLSLVPIEYERGVSRGVVTKALEIREAATFRDGAAAAFADLRTLLDARDPAKTQQIAAQLATLAKQLAAAEAGTQVVAPDALQASVEQIEALLKETMPAAWQQHDSGADFDVIRAALDQMESAVVAGQYDLAESARLEAYAVLESGPEAKLIVFAPQYKPILEGLFWYGQEAHQGLAFLISRHAPAAEIKATRIALDTELAAAEKALAGNNAPAAVASNAAVLVFREGLEAVLILASLMASFKSKAQRALRQSLWGGAALALIASVLTWLLARGALVALARYGERLEAIVSLIAIGVLLLITNWFFHDVYWTGWMANFHQQKKRVVSGSAGQLLGLVVLGFTSIYREGFETVLFLQALVLESGIATVLTGIGIGLAATFLVGIIVFGLQAKLPAKKMLIVTGIMIGAVLLQMVGNTAHVLQVLGWLPTSPIRALTPWLPYWAGLWFGLYATWEGIALQFAAGAFTIGSYVLAERWHHKQRIAEPAPLPRPQQQNR